jgi:hypothetical protein
MAFDNKVVYYDDEEKEEEEQQEDIEFNYTALKFPSNGTVILK